MGHWGEGGGEGGGYFGDQGSALVSERPLEQRCLV